MDGRILKQEPKVQEQKNRDIGGMLKNAKQNRMFHGVGVVEVVVGGEGHNTINTNSSAEKEGGGKTVLKK